MTTLGNQAHVLKYKLAVAGVRKANDPLRLAHTVRHLGDAYRHAGQTSESEACYVEALSIYRSRDDRNTLDLANAIRGYAVLKNETGHWEEARLLWQEAHDLYLSVGVTAGVAGSASRLALLAHREGDLQKSNELLREAIAAAESAGDPEVLQHVREIKAQIEQ